jgi:hypothetical protein
MAKRGIVRLVSNMSSSSLGAKREGRKVCGIPYNNTPSTKLRHAVQPILTLLAKAAPLGFPAPRRFPTRVEHAMLKATGNMKQKLLMD